VCSLCKQLDIAPHILQTEKRQTQKRYLHKTQLLQIQHKVDYKLVVCGSTRINKFHIKIQELQNLCKKLLPPIHITCH
jgi:hypothetical protein